MFMNHLHQTRKKKGLVLTRLRGIENEMDERRGLNGGVDDNLANVCARKSVRLGSGECL